MACFLAPLTEAIIVSAVKKSVEKKERLAAEPGTPLNYEVKSGIPFSRKMGWLTKMLWGGSFLLAIEHIWHGEVVPWPPFLTAMSNPADIGPMLKEIATVGVTMVVLITAIWGLMLLVTSRIEKKAARAKTKMAEV